jgi:hypothetical protein
VTEPRCPPPPRPSPASDPTHDGLLVLSAGADLLFALEGAEALAAADLIANCSRDEIRPQEPSSRRVRPLDAAGRGRRRGDCGMRPERSGMPADGNRPP